VSKAFLEKNREIAVDTSLSAEEGLQRLNGNHYDAIVSDYQMPVMDGVQFLKQVRLRDPHIPFILFTGKGREEVVIEAINNGADFYIQKGGSPRAQFIELEHKIKQSIRRERAENEVRLNEKRLRQIIDLVPHFIFAKDIEGTYILVNKAVADAYGTTVEELTGKKDADFARSEAEAAHFRADDSEVISSGESKLIHKEPMTDSQGITRYLTTTKIPFWFSGTVTPAVLGVSVDITDRKRAEDDLARQRDEIQAAYEQLAATEEELQAQNDMLTRSERALRKREHELREKSELLEALLNAIPDVIGIQDPHHGIIRYNAAGYAFVGRTPDEVSGKKCYELIGHDIPCEICATSQTYLTKKPARVEKYVPELDVWLDVRSYPIVDEAGTIKQIVEHIRDISAIKVAEEKLRKEHEQLEEIAANIPGVVYRFYARPDGTMGFNYISPRSVEILGIDNNLADFLPHCAEHIHPDDQRRFQDSIAEAVRSGSGWDFTGRFCKHSGEQIWIRGLSNPVEKGSELIYSGVLLDVTGQVEKEQELHVSYEKIAAAEEELRAQFDSLAEVQQELHQSKERYKILVDNTEFPVMVTGLESGNVLFINESASRFFGVPVKEALNQHARDYWVHPEDRDLFARELESRGTLTNFETTLRTRGGEVRWNLINATLIDFCGERAAYVIYTDITDRKHAEHELQRSQSLFQTIFRASPAATIFSRLEDGRCIDANERYLELVGYTGDELIGKSTLDLGIWADPQERARIIRELAEKKALSDVPIQIRRRDGAIRYTIASGEIVTLDGHKYILSFFYDITKGKLADETLRQSEEKFRALFENQQNGVVIIDPQNHIILDANPAAMEMIGMKKDEIVGNVCHTVMCPAEEGKCPITDLCQEIDHSERILASRISGHFPIIKSVKKVRYAEKDHLIESFVSIEDRKKSEEALRKANDQLNLLTSITRHDILNKITAVLGFLEIARESSRERELTNTLDRIKNLTDAIKTQIEFTKIYQDIGSHEPLWQNITTLTKSLHIPEEISFTRDCEPYDFYSDPLIEKVFQNLLDNSLRHGERVTAIRLSCKEDDRGLNLVWEDNGVGIPREEKDIIFSRGYGKNSGYGLFLIREILNITGITIYETGEPGSGVRFEIHIPPGIYRRSARAL
jgi:PAS domain S-box-containing protein